MAAVRSLNRALLMAAIIMLFWDSTRGSLLQWSDHLCRRRSSWDLQHKIVGAVVTRRIRGSSELDNCDLDMLEYFHGQSRSRRSAGESSIVQLVNRVKMWPPWPLSLLQRQKEDDNEGDSSETNKEEDNQEVTASNSYPSAAAVALAWFTQRARIGVRQLQEVGSSLWFHFPPTLPPLLLIASLPRKIGGGGDIPVRTMIPLFADPFVRTLVLSGFGVAVLSWAHQELNRKRKLTPLPLALPYQQSVSRVFLPPFLPELVPEPEIEALQQTTTTSASATGNDESEQVDDGDSEDPNQIFSQLNPRLRKHLSAIYENTPLIGGGKTHNPLRSHGFFKERKRKREIRKREAAKIRRATIFDELVALQAIKRKSARGRKSRSDESEVVAPLGYALVTGASQGIGRALAVELARWEIPLVLVARDLDRLTSLAYDLEACYGVRCCVLEADLSETDAAERIHEATSKAGLTVDILVNNAGIAYEGLSTNIETALMERMIMINTMSFAKLSKLYGQDMIARRRGRILMVSSMAGLCSASPNTALYGATKAFEKSLAFSMSKEFEPYGVGVTCLMPGPVTNTQFKARSGSKALCWYLPYYPRPADSVAHLGIASLLDGDTQVVPGWQNRAFAQLARLILPQRVEIMCVQAAWSPFRLPTWKSLFGSQNTPPQPIENPGGLVNTTPPESVHLDLKPRYSFQMPPRLLKLEEKPVPPLEANEAEPDLPPTADPSSDSTGQDSVANNTIENPLHPGESGDPSASSRPVKESNSSNAPGTFERIADTPAEEPQRDKTAPAEETMPPTTKEITPKDGSSVTVAPPVLLERKTSTQNQSHDKDRETDEKENAEQTAKSETVGTRRRSQPSEDFRTQFDDEEDATSDLYLSPRLGPVDLFQGRHRYALPRASTPAKVPKWTVQA